MSLLMPLELIGEGECLAACFACMLGNITNSLAVLTGQMVLEVIFLNKLFVTVLTLELSLGLVSQFVLF